MSNEMITTTPPTAARRFESRSPRIVSQLDRFNCMAHYFPVGQGHQAETAQFVDISMTGMRLISKHMTNARVGEVLDVEFTLPGIERTMQQKACVVRTVNDFVFAVRFIGIDQQRRQRLENALLEYGLYVRFANFIVPVKSAFRWMRNSKQGITIAVLAAVLGASLGTYIYLHSDEHKGITRGWGQNYPKEWALEYYKNYSK